MDKDTCYSLPGAGASQYRFAGQEQSQYCSPAIQRPTAQDALNDIISSLRLKLNQLEALQRALPQELSLPADEILRDLVLSLRRDRPDKY